MVFGPTGWCICETIALMQLNLILVPLFVAATPLVAQEPVIRLDVNLVQVDAVVTDSKDKHVGNLTAHDFENPSGRQAAEDHEFFLDRSGYASRSSRRRGPRRAAESCGGPQDARVRG